MLVVKEAVKIVTTHLIRHVLYIKNIIFNCCPGEVGMCLLCEKHRELLRANEILSGNVRKNLFLTVVLVMSVLICCA